MLGRMVAAAALTVLAGCSGGGGGDDDSAELIGPDRSYTKAIEIADDQWVTVSNIQAAEGWTAWTDMPAMGTGSYRGVISGGTNGGEPVDYVADLALRVNFDNAAVTGSVENMVTDHATDFVHPEGTVRLNGRIEPDEYDTGVILIGGSGTLQTDDVEATVVVDGIGDFVGTDGRGIMGGHLTDFI
jgi:hypothetical protein